MQARTSSRYSFGPGRHSGVRAFTRSQKRFSGSSIDVSKFIQKNPVAAQPAAPYQAQNHFSDFALDARLQKNIAHKGYASPTPIQDKVIPLVMEGRDVVGIANTGQGKTAAFLLPAINKTILNRGSKTIIIVPTRELALQIEKEFKDFAFGLQMFSVTCIGGTGIRNQIYNLRKSNNFIIGTPGRLKDLNQRGALNLSGFSTVVLDEADRMLDMGFIADIKHLLGLMPRQRQTLCFSATFPASIEQLVGQFSDHPVKISVRTQESSANVTQDIVRVPDSSKKLEVLCDLLAKQDFSKVLVFGRTKWGVEKLSIALAHKGFKADSIHGGKTQSKREKALDQFKANRVNILVATDVAARGLDIDDVSHVINYDVPATYDDYIHRIGRTGRYNKRGIALTFVS